MMASPLVWRGETLGIVYLDSKGIAAFTKPDVELLSGICAQAAVALGNARLHQQLLEKKRLEQDLQLAERIQQSFLPRRIPKMEGFTFAARYDPAHEVGGDFYDFVRLPDDRLGIVVGDVSGKGVGAALYMARLTRDLRYFALAEPDPARVLSWMNTAVGESGQDDIFVTLVYVVLDAQQQKILMANAGHMPPIVRKKAEREVTILEEISGLPLGVMPNPEYLSTEFVLEPGDTVMLFTDGLVEAMNPSREMYGMERLVRSIGAGPSDVPSLVDRALADCQRHVSNAAQFDDTTIVCFGRDDQKKIPDVDTNPSSTADDARREAMLRIRRLKRSR
jgi:serine phosphatase RsbU (regulator of sigma subunit)